MGGESNVDCRHLEIALIQAERAWATGMELKNDSDNARTRFHAARRYGKAAKWGHLLVKLCNTTCDKRTKLEAKVRLASQRQNLRRRADQLLP